jgi:hypothetical protein
MAKKKEEEKPEKVIPVGRDLIDVLRKQEAEARRKRQTKAPPEPENNE